MINKSKELEKSSLKLNMLDIIPGKLKKIYIMNKYKIGKRNN